MNVRDTQDARGRTTPTTNVTMGFRGQLAGIDGTVNVEAGPSRLREGTLDRPQGVTDLNGEGSSVKRIAVPDA